MRFSLAMGVSVALHAALAAGAVFLIRHSPSRAAPPELDVSSVEVSFAEEEDDLSPLSPVPPAPPPLPPVPDASAPPPEPDLAPLDALPPEPDALLLPEPSKEAPEKMDLPVEKETKRETKRDVPKAEVPNGAAAPRQAKIEAPPKPTKAIRPDYPDGARRRGEEGEVRLEIEVDEEGGVARAKVTGGCGYRELEEAALKAVRRARFTPAKSGGRPVASSASLTVTFRLTGR